MPNENSNLKKLGVAGGLVALVAGALLCLAIIVWSVFFLAQLDNDQETSVKAETSKQVKSQEEVQKTQKASSKKVFNQKKKSDITDEKLPTRTKQTIQERKAFLNRENRNTKPKFAAEPEAEEVKEVAREEIDYENLTREEEIRMMEEDARRFPPAEASTAKKYPPREIN